MRSRGIFTTSTCPPEQIKLESIVQTVLTRASAFIYANAVGLIKGFTYFFFDLILVLFITFFMFLQGDDFIYEIKQLSPLEPAQNEEILRETELTIKATLWGTVFVAFVQGALGGLGFLIFGLPQPAFWGTVMVPAAVIPLVGSAGGQEELLSSGNARNRKIVRILALKCLGGDHD